MHPIPLQLKLTRWLKICRPLRFKILSFSCYVIKGGSNLKITDETAVCDHSNEAVLLVLIIIIIIIFFFGGGGSSLNICNKHFFNFCKNKFKKFSILDLVAMIVGTEPISNSHYVAHMLIR